VIYTRYRAGRGRRDNAHPLDAYVATVTAQIGAIAVSRGVAKTDMALSDEALQAVRETIDAALTAVTAIPESD
jgi:hypothetical protein